jgi:tRNA dimethylallyltransferase
MAHSAHLSAIPPGAAPKPVFLGGPTAVGKSELALQLAEALGGEIISVDSMQVYRGLDVGTAKPSPEDRARIPHHLIDVCDLAENFDAAQFVQLAEAAVADIHSRQRVPIFCGGTGLYFKAFLEGLGASPATTETLRSELEQTPLDQLLSELEQRDPVTFARIDQKNPRRVIRAVGVIRLTGRPFSDQRAEWDAESTAATPEPSARIFCFVRSREDLHRRIHTRVEAMFARSLVAETDHLLKLGLENNKTAMQAIGYRQVVEYLRGERNLPETIELVKARTRQYSKRQLSWFRAQKNVTWLELNEAETPETILQKLGPIGSRSPSP